MSEQIALVDVIEAMRRIQQFKDMPPEQRTIHLDFIASSRCSSEKANRLFDDFCKGETGEEEAFFNHIGQCSSCHSAFLRLVWLSTD